MRLFLLLFLTGCCHAIPPLPEHITQVRTSLKDKCISQTFAVTNEFIGFDGDTTEVPIELCSEVSGFTLEEWIEMEQFLRAVFDTHNIPDDKINLHNGAIDYVRKSKEN